MNKLSVIRQQKFGPVAQLGERTVRIREVRGFDPLRVHHQPAASNCLRRVILYPSSTRYSFTWAALISRH